MPLHSTRRTCRHPLVCAFLALAATWTGTVRADSPVDFNRDIRPLLSKNCFACHGPDEGERQGGFRLDQRQSALDEADSGEHVIVPGDSLHSELVARISTEDEDLRMPPADAGPRLKPEEVALIKRWIDAGAPYAEHWSFISPRAMPVPEVAHADRVRNGIDGFILSRVEAAGLTPAPEADRATLLRRLSLDLRGLPPTPDEVLAFIQDPRPDAYERLVDRYLADPAFGERWGRIWLDLARYADSAGYGSDPLRTIWRYRDWVIDALNANMPFDQFTIEQLAGDLLPNATLEQQIATAFHRNTMTNTEGGTDDEEFRTAAVKDRVDTTMQVWMGLTMGCAQCHNHKYDPIAQREYYEFYAFFNQTADTDLPSEQPVLKAPTQEDRAYEALLDRRIAELRTVLETPTAVLAAAQQAWEKTLTATPTWQALIPDPAQQAEQVTSHSDGNFSLKAAGADSQSSEITFTADRIPLTGLRLEGWPITPAEAAEDQPRHPHVIVTGARVSAEDGGTAGGPVRGRYVRVELPGQEKMLSLAEVQVFSAGNNVALKAKAKQSSTGFGGKAELAIDGNTNGEYHAAMSTTHTAQSKDPWWELDLVNDQPIERLVVWNRTDGDLQPRLHGYRISVLDADRNLLWSRQPDDVPHPNTELTPGTRRDVQFSVAYGTGNHAPNDATALLNAAPDSDGEWTIAPSNGPPSSVILVPDEPISPITSDATLRLTLRLSVRSETRNPATAAFRFSSTGDAGIQQRGRVPEDMLALVDVLPEERSVKQQQQLAEYYRTIAPQLKAVRRQIAALEKSRPEPVTVPVLQQLPADKRRQTHVMVKGNFLAPAEAVEAGVPQVFHAWPDDAPQSRWGMARWLVSPDNPLTGRVMMNRLWARLFGKGLVETEEDFGSQGELPSHPELLDWLAVRFEEDWDIKRALRLLVMSNTYRQSSVVEPSQWEKDPRNRWLARGPRFRLEAEMVRDQALALSGLLSQKLHGPSVYPPQPPGLWRAAFNGQRTWPTSTGEDRYRRGLYVFWRRTVPYPSMATFDAPSRELCEIRRIPTNTPLQALVTLNDPVYVEAAQALARRILQEGGDDDASRAEFALRLCLVREPGEQQKAALVDLITEQRAHYRDQTEAAGALATDPLGPLPEAMDVTSAAAWTVAANVLLNLDGVLTRW